MDVKCPHCKNINFTGKLITDIQILFECFTCQKFFTVKKNLNNVIEIDKFIKMK